MDEGKQDEVTLFSDEERRRIVRSFIDAYLRGSVKIQLPTKKSLAELKRRNPELYTLFEKQTRAFMTDPVGFFRREFSDLIGIVTGARKATSEETQVAVDSIFMHIVEARKRDAIEGEFIESRNLESKIKNLEERIGSLENLLHELQTLIRTTRGQL